MLTRNAALTAGRIVCAALAHEQQDPRTQGPDNQARYHARGVAVRAMHEMYMAMNDKARASFKYECDSYMAACGWPD